MKERYGFEESGELFDERLKPGVSHVLFSKLKNWRLVAMRYDKTRESCFGFVSLASAFVWLPFHDA